MSDENTITNPGSDENTLADAGAPNVANASRRRFLKAALVGSAATVAVGAAAVVGLERAGAAPGLAHFPILGNSGSPGGSTGSACTTGTDPTNYVPQSSFGHKEGIFLWGLFTNLPAGSYSVSVSPAIQAEGSGCVSSSTPFDYVGAGSAVRIYDLSASSVTWDCSPKTQSQLNTPKFQSSSLSGNSVTVSAGDDLQVQLHMKNGGCAVPYTITETINLYQGTNTTPFLTASATITVTTA